MKIYLSHSTKYDYQTNLYQPLKNSKLNTQYEINYFLEDDAPNKVKSSKEVIMNSDIIIAEVSIKSIAIGLELGWADAYGKRIILIHNKDAYVSKYLTILTKDIITYSNTDDLIFKLEQCLEK